MPDTRLRAPKKVGDVLRKVVEELDQAAVESAPVSTDPGEIVRGEKIPWTKKELAKRNEGRVVSFTPEENMTIRWNGLEWYLREGVDFEGPWIVKYEYDRIRRVRRLAGRSGLTQGGAFEVNRLGDGPLPPASVTGE